METRLLYDNLWLAEETLHMGFLKVFRWILFGFALLFGLFTAAFASYYFLPEGPLLDAIKEYVAESGYTIELLVGTYAFLAVGAFVLFIIFSIIVSNAKKRQRRRNSYSNTSSKEEEPNLEDRILFVSKIDENKTIGDLLSSMPFIANWDEDNQFPTIYARDNVITIGDEHSELSVYLKKNNIFFRPANPSNPFDNYPIISLVPVVDKPNMSLLIISSRDVTPGVDDQRIFEVMDQIHQQTTSDADEIVPADGHIESVFLLGNDVKDFVDIIKKQSIATVIKEWMEDGYFARFEYILTNIFDKEVIKEYLRGVFDDLHNV